MAKYMIAASYTQSGVQGLLKEGGTGRRDAITKLVGSLGGSLESVYYAFGADDVFVIADVPDNVSAAAIGLTVAATGAVNLRTIVLLTPEEVDEASKKSVDYRPPGA
jgi:uncharacterized protein with GYD domain